MPTLYVTDLDGTLLPSSGALPPEWARRLSDLVAERGVLLTYATARSHLMAARVVGPAWGTAAVVYNGAFTVDPLDGRAVRSHVVDPAVTLEILESCRVLGLMPLVFTSRGGCSQGEDSVRWLRGRETPGVERFLADRPADPRLAPCDDWAGLVADPAFYVSVIGSETEIAALAAHLLPLLAGRCTTNIQSDTYHPQDWWLEITPHGVTKATEIRHLAQGLGADRIVCFGDNNNDLPLFEVADECLAVANATALVKERASSVIGSNEDGGVLAWLETHAQ